ncbi:LOW QUALITY PROTEIN: uncharacterized protein CG4449 [Drosophila ficusphila]|uniref:LOW QUALITY PROTEIN: uncharacterized protein CG4449 n=1 Tax=Drosophila ficusphila TaxID=30025 RepID=UPI001C8A5C7F|nr:LOW QUALITY PROTEIN: uncharacterized protein CG4449 [Drosophila ficusphila]
MSDDEFDIFSAARKRAPVIALPQDSYNPSNDSFSKEAEYDFIEDSPKKSIKNKKRKAREKAQKNEEGPSPPKQNKQNLAETEIDEKDVTERALSPVSKLILEMEQNNAKQTAAKVDKKKVEPKEDPVGPVARRTRSSLSKVQKEPPPVEPVVQETTKAKPKTRGRKRRSTEMVAVENLSASVVSSLESIVARFSKNNSRRQTVAEMAARSKVVDSIDLVSAVAPRVEGFVNLNSDEEEDDPAPKEEENVFTDINPTIEVALSWLGEIQIYKMRQHQKFKHMFKEVAERNGVDESEVSVDMYHNFIGPEDTPHNIDLKSFHTLSGRATKSNNNNDKKVTAKDDPLALFRKPKKFQVKVQAVKWKHPMVMPMKKDDNFKMLYIKCAEELNSDARHIKLFFDGELLDPEDTPENQDMEGNELIDLQIKS